jgi:hypothetical protein
MARLRREEGRRSSRPEAVVSEVASGCWVLPWDPTRARLCKNLPLLNGIRLSAWLVLRGCAGVLGRARVRADRRE